MQVMFVLGLEHDLTKPDTTTPDGLTRIGLQDDMTFIGSAAALNRFLNELECTLAEAGRSAGTSAVCGRLGLSRSRSNNYFLEIRNLCTTVPRKRLGIGLLRSGGNVQHTMHAGLGQLAEAPTQTVKGLKKAVTTLESIERFAYDQHDHVSFAKVWMLLSRGGCQVGRPRCNEAWKTSSGRRCHRHHHPHTAVPRPRSCADDWTILLLAQLVVLPSAHARTAE